MSIFCFKKLPLTTSLGQQLQKRREERCITLDDIASATHIQKKYLSAIEQGNFRKLPTSRTFRLAYIREYAHLVGLPTEACLDQFTREGGLEGIALIHPHQTIKYSSFTSLATMLRLGLVAGGVLLFGVYLTGQIIRIVRPPQLVLYAPLEGEVISQLNTIIQGQTEPESTLTINGQAAMVNNHGEFETKIDLAHGVNTITVEATKKHGKISTITRHLVVQLPKRVEQVSLNKNENSGKMGL